MGGFDLCLLAKIFWWEFINWEEYDVKYLG